MYVYTPVRNNAGRATTLALAHYPFSGQPPSRRAPALPRALPPSLPCHTNPYRYLYALPPTTHIARPLPPPANPFLPPSASHIALHLNSVSTASLLLPSATHTTHPLLSPPSRTPSFSPLYVPFSFPFCFHFRLPQTPDPIHPAGKTVRCRKYGNTGAVSQRECDNTKNFD